MKISAQDLIILRMLQENSRERLETIAMETGLSVATVQRRIRNLKADGTIMAESALISPKAVGYAMTFLVFVELEHERIDQIDAFRRKAKAEPQVQQCYYITGEADFALIALARDMEDYEQLTHRLFFQDSNVKRFRTSVVMDRTKVGMRACRCEETRQEAGMTGSDLGAGVVSSTGPSVVSRKSSSCTSIFPPGRSTDGSSVNTMPGCSTVSSLAANRRPFGQLHAEPVPHPPDAAAAREILVEDPPHGVKDLGAGRAGTGGAQAGFGRFEQARHRPCRHLGTCPNAKLRSKSQIIAVESRAGVEHQDVAIFDPACRGRRDDVAIAARTGPADQVVDIVDTRFEAGNLEPAEDLDLGHAAAQMLGQTPRRRRRR
jgi:Lrp/AsnC family leucine-responsive transcriptional regulator